MGEDVPKTAGAQREQTDRSLGDERRKTDEELAKRRDDIEKEADAVVVAARERADDVLRRARDGADDKREQTRTPSTDRAILGEERRREDEALKQERASADDELEEERVAGRRALTALLALERSQTNDHLYAERHRTEELIGSRDEVLAVVSHDLRNLLGSILLTAGALLRVEAQGSAAPEVERHAHRIQRFVGRMNRLVGDLLDIVSIESGRLAVAPERHDAKELLGEIVEVFRPLANLKRITLTSDVRAGSTLARYDDDRILQVLANLVGNAIKFTGEGGSIELVVEIVAEDIRFMVRDTGVGIHPSKLKVIFERFSQVSESHRSGLGLGLYISKCIVESHGGRIWGESELGVGSVFFFSLPTADSDRVPAEP